MGILSASCGLDLSTQAVPGAPSQSHRLLSPPWVVDRMTSAVPDLYFDLNRLSFADESAANVINLLPIFRVSFATIQT